MRVGPGAEGDEDLVDVRGEAVQLHSDRVGAFGQGGPQNVA